MQRATRNNGVFNLIETKFDVAIIGGGINGAVSAAILSARGVKVILIEQNDFASFTSQESSNMVWGGIKYLQTYEVPLVWALCGSRNELMRAFPNRIKATSFFAAVGPTAPFGKILGFFGASLYWILGRFKTKSPEYYSRDSAKEHEPLISTEGLKGAVQYDDALLLDNDSRFVWDFIKSAKKYGATCLNYVKMVHAEESPDGWSLKVVDQITGEEKQVKSEIFINAAGPFASELNNNLGAVTKNTLALSKGIHLVVPKLTDHEHVMAFFDDDQRLFYVIPMHDRSVIGTTDTRVSEPTNQVTDEDRDFVLQQANRCLELFKPLTKADIISERSGVRPLVVKQKEDVKAQDWTSLSRKHEIEVDKKKKLITIFGGKLTDCINVGKEVSDLVKKFGIKEIRNRKWYGEDLEITSSTYFSEVAEFFPKNLDLAKKLLAGLIRRHGAGIEEILNLWRTDGKNSQVVFEGLDFTKGELIYILENEEVIKPDDLLRRRTPIQLVRTQAEIEQNKVLQEVLSLLKS
jgi:glycerol-3-phosphate dehydrogenase